MFLEDAGHVDTHLSVIKAPDGRRDHMVLWDYCWNNRHQGSAEVFSANVLIFMVFLSIGPDSTQLFSLVNSGFSAHRALSGQKFCGM